MSGVTFELTLKLLSQVGFEVAMAREECLFRNEVVARSRREIFRNELTNSLLTAMFVTVAGMLGHTNVLGTRGGKRSDYRRDAPKERLACDVQPTPARFLRGTGRILGTCAATFPRGGQALPCSSGKLIERRETHV